MECYAAIKLVILHEFYLHKVKKASGYIQRDSTYKIFRSRQSDFFKAA